MSTPTRSRPSNAFPLNDGRTIFLVTPAEFEQLPDGTVLVCIDGTSAVKGRNLVDQDTRGGYLAFGLVD